VLKNENLIAALDQGSFASLRNPVFSGSRLPVKTEESRHSPTEASTGCFSSIFRRDNAGLGTPLSPRRYG